MNNWSLADNFRLQILEKPEYMSAIEELQRIVWPGNETEIVPTHILITIAHNGGIVIGAFDISRHQISEEKNRPEIDQDIPPGSPLVGFVYGFPGIYPTPDGPRLKHTSHQMGVHPEYRSKGLGFLLKRAQWQIVRHQEIDRITWTYDPLLSRNGHLNISKLGAVCNTYLRNVYGDLRDGLNIGLPTDRFQVDWWTNSSRVKQRLSKNVRRKLDLAHFISAGAEIINPTIQDHEKLPQSEFDQIEKMTAGFLHSKSKPPILLIEIPTDFLGLKAKNISLARKWRLMTRDLFEFYFQQDYLITDFVHIPGVDSRSFYVLSFGNRTL